MVSRNSAFALTVMLLVSAPAQAVWYEFSFKLPTLPSLPSYAQLKTQALDASVFTGKVAAAVLALRVVYNLGSKMLPSVPSAVVHHAKKAYSYVPASVKTAAAPLCNLTDRVSALEVGQINLGSRVTNLENTLNNPPAGGLTYAEVKTLVAQLSSRLNPAPASAGTSTTASASATPATLPAV